MSIGIRRVEVFAGVALFRIYMAWEDFLENVFLRYMCGAETPSGFSPLLIVSSKRSINEAMNELLGRGFRYLNWSSNNTLTRARIYFDQGEPFETTINSISNLLGEISAIRNSFAHRSDFARNEFRNVVRNAFGYLPRGLSPGRFLLTANPSSVIGEPFIDYYAQFLLGASQAIVP